MGRRADKEFKDGGPRNEHAITSELVMRTLITRTPEVYARTNDGPGARIVHQRTSAGRLTVIEERRF